MVRPTQASLPRSISRREISLISGTNSLSNSPEVHLFILLNLNYYYYQLVASCSWPAKQKSSGPMVCVPAALQTPGEANLPFETVPKRKVVLLLHLFFSSQKKERKRKKKRQQGVCQHKFEPNEHDKRKNQEGTVCTQSMCIAPCATTIAAHCAQKTAGASFLFLFRFENMKYDSFLGFENIKCWERRNLPGRTRGAPADQRAPRL